MVFAWGLSGFRNKIIFGIIFLALYSVLPAMQYEVGVDYHSYMRMMEFGVEQRIVNAGEWIIVWVDYFIDYFDFPNQSIFFIYSLIIGIFLVKFLKIIRKAGYDPATIIFLYFAITGYYFSQFNTIRQSLAIAFIMVAFACLFFERKIFTFILYSLLSVMSHSVALVPVVIFAIIYIFHGWLIRYRVLLMAALLLSLILVVYGFGWLLNLFFPEYVFYLIDYNFDFNINNLLTKIYWAPLIIWYFYSVYRRGGVNSEGVAFILTFPLVFLIYIIPFHGGRVFQYFIFLWIFPIYYILRFVKSMRSRVLFFLLVAYIALPLILKLLIFPSDEYIYRSFIPGIF
jgi:hypothetical protein